MTERLPIVVGIDGTPESFRALEWAVADARTDHCAVHIVCCYSASRIYATMAMYGDLLVQDTELLREAAQSTVVAAEQHAAAIAPDVEVSGQISDADPATVLIEASGTASRVVLGSRRLGPAGSAVLGSVGTAVSARAAGPVVVLRGPAGDVGEGSGVVVGIDAQGGAPEDAQSVLAYAFDFADRHRVPLRAVLCWHLDVLAELAWSPTPPAPTKGTAWLSEALAGWREKYPDVVVHEAVVRDRAVAGLVAASAAQQLLVVGSHGRGPLAGALLGSVSQGVLHHANCPVAVIALHRP